MLGAFNIVQKISNSKLARRAVENFYTGAMKGIMGDPTAMVSAGLSTAAGAFTGTAKTVAKGAAKGTAKLAVKAAPIVAKGASNLAYGAGYAVGNGAVTAAEMFKDADGLYSKAIDKTTGRITNKILDAAFNHSNVVRYDENGWVKGFNKKGKAIGWGIVGAGALVSGINEYEDKHMGSFDSTIHSLTPDYSPYMKMKAPAASPSPAPAGADGSLVFALDRAKNGGFL